MLFQAKKDLIFGIAIWHGPILLLIFLAFYYSLTLLIIFACLLGLSFWIWNSTEYRIEDNELFIKQWVLRKRITISDIESIKKVKNILSSYALSYERLEIRAKSHSKLYIAPLEFDKFINEIKNKNPNVVIH